MNPAKRNRVVYLGGACLAVALGLASRRYASALPGFIARYAGDTLWAAMVFALIGAIAVRWPTARVAVATLLVSYVVEVSQLYHAPWIDGIRDIRFARLVLGEGFLLRDIVCYTVGVVLCVVLETACMKRNDSPGRA